MEKSLKIVIILLIAAVIVWWFMKKNENYTQCKRPDTNKDSCESNCDCKASNWCENKKCKGPCARPDTDSENCKNNCECIKGKKCDKKTNKCVEN